jgi:signal recognition particle subunit SRP54
MKKMLMMMPGAQNIRQQLEQFDEREIDRVEAIVRSMTPHERVAPKIINGSRRARIAKGSGMHVSDVNGLLERFAQAQKMMKKMAAGGGMPGMPGMPGMGGGGGARKGGAKNAPKKKAKSGNPAKAAQELREAEARRANASKALPTGAAFGQQGADFDPSQLNLPKGFDKFLGGSK